MTTTTPSQAPAPTASQPAAPQGGAYAELADNLQRAVNQTDADDDVIHVARWFVEDAIAALRASHGQAPAGATDWWRKRADEIEAQVAATGSQEAMRCYTDMRTLLQAATAQPAPAAHVQNPAEIEHVAGDVSKNGPESNMAQQPDPSAAAAVDAEREGLRVAIRSAIQASRYHFVDPVRRDTADRVLLDLLDVINARAAAPKPSPTPQADSQPAPVQDYPPLPEPDLGMPWRVNAKSDGAAHSSGFTCEQMRAYVDADRAARAPADSVLEDAARLEFEMQHGPAVERVSKQGGA